MPTEMTDIWCAWQLALNVWCQTTLVFNQTCLSFFSCFTCHTLFAHALTQPLPSAKQLDSLHNQECCMQEQPSQLHALWLGHQAREFQSDQTVHSISSTARMQTLLGSLDQNQTAKGENHDVATSQPFQVFFDSQATTDV